MFFKLNKVLLTIKYSKQSTRNKKTTDSLKIFSTRKTQIRLKCFFANSVIESIKMTA